MKNRIFALCLALLMAMGALALADVPDKPSEFAYAYDFSGAVLDSGDVASIAEYGEALETQTGVQAIAVVVDFLDGMEAGDYATDIINSWGVGSADEDNGVVVLLARGDRDIFIGTGRGIDRKLTGSKCGELIDENIDYFANNQFDKGMTALYADVCEYVARVEGKTLFPKANTSSAVQQSAYAPEKKSEGGLFSTILGFVVIYLILCVVVNAIFRGKSCCLKMFFLGWLFDKNDRRDPRPPTPPMQTRQTPRPPTYTPPMNTPPMGGGFGTPRSTGGLFGGHIGGYKGTHGGYKGSSLFGGSTGRSSAGRSTTSRSTTRSTFGGGSSRGGGAGRSFGSSVSKSSFGSSSRSSFGSSRSSFGGSRGGGRSFGGGGSRGGGGGRKF